MVDAWEDQEIGFFLMRQEGMEEIYIRIWRRKYRMIWNSVVRQDLVLQGCNAIYDTWAIKNEL